EWGMPAATRACWAVSKGSCNHRRDDRGCGSIGLGRFAGPPGQGQENSVSRLLATLAIIWRLAKPYFVSDDRLAGRSLLAGVVAIELSLTTINILINRWQAHFYNALQDRAWNAFVEQLMVFCVLALSYVVLAAYQVYLQQWLMIRWRAWM